MTRRFVTGALVAAGVTLATPAASAQEAGFGVAGGFVISAERVFGFTATKTKSEGEIRTGPATADYESETDHSHFDLLVKGDVSDPFAAPRMAFDYFVIDGLSVGGALGYSTDSLDGDFTVGNTKTNIDEETGSGFIIYPRVGYAFMFSPEIGIWPRGGLTYWNAKEEIDRPGNQDTTDTKGSGLNFSVEAMLVIAPVEHGAFFVGPTLDLPITSGGEVEQGNTTIDLDRVSITTYGIQAGVGVWF